MNCIIIDDEQPARKLLENYIAKIAQLTLIGSFKSGVDALATIEKEQPELIITDIQMPELKGNDLIKTLMYKPKVIFTTAYPDYAVEGFELEITDYLLKPFGFDRFVKAVKKALEANDNTTANNTVFKRDYLTVKADHKIYKINYADIRYIEGMREYVSFHLAEKRITALLSLKSLENDLPDTLFIRCHKSFIVNKSRVEALDSGNLQIGDKQIPIGQSYRERVLADIF